MAEVAEKLIGTLLFSQSPASVVSPRSRTGTAGVSASLLTEVKVTVEYRGREAGSSEQSGIKWSW